ncbi:DNA-binding protein [Burkholderia sp. WSM2230]|uniref:DNA-binding protein n=1 Tax=Burkholderia sp. WSM2230 TaxID=944435 RepID=UPI00046E5840|nr:DNA-binding protein [Burkholderia sp. WSM2230]
MSMETDTVTDERVAQIADRMAGEGKKVSALAIWGEVRSGSIVAVSAALERWRQARQPASAEAPAPVMTSLPDDVAQTMLSAAGNLWASAREEAERVVNQRLALAGGHADAIAAERDEALAEYQNTLAEAELARERVATLTNALSISEDAVNRLATELPALRDRAKAAEDRVAELEDRAAAAESRVAQTEEREAASEARIAEAEERARAAEARLVEFEQRATAAESRVAEFEQRALAAEARLQAAETSLTEERQAREGLSTAAIAKDEEIARLIHERDVAHENAAALGEAGEAHAKEVQRWAEESSAASSRAEDAALQASESLAQLAALQTELDQTRAQLSAERDAQAARGDEAAAQRAELERVRQELAAAREQLTSMSEANAAATAETTRLAQDVSAAASRAETAEQRVTELERQLAELESTHAQRLAQVQQENAATDTASPEHESKEAAMAEELASLRRQMTSQAKAHEKAYGELRTLAEQWIAHAKELKQRLGATNQKVTFLDARSAAEVALLRRLSSELERLKPDHDLVSRDAQQKLISATLAERLEQKGYRYDPATAVMSKIEA